jgi:hypothetical protein
VLDAGFEIFIPTVMHYLGNWYFKDDPQYRSKMVDYDDMPSYYQPGMRLLLDIQGIEARTRHHFDFKDKAGPKYIREFRRTAEVEKATNQHCFPVADLLTHTIPATLLSDDVVPHQAIELDLLVEILALQKDTASFPIVNLHTVANYAKSTMAQIKERRLEVPTNAESAIKIADVLVFGDPVKTLDRKADLSLTPSKFQQNNNLVLVGVWMQDMLMNLRHTATALEKQASCILPTAIR